MRKKNYKGRCEKRVLSKCIGICRTYDALQYAYPKTEIQQCVIHQIRNTTRFVSYKDIKARLYNIYWGNQSIELYKKE